MEDQKNNYSLVKSLSEIRKYIGEAQVVAFDFETAPDDNYRSDDKAALDSARSHIVTCSLSVAEQTAIVIPVAHRIGTNIAYNDFIRFLRELLSSKTIIKVAHNIAFEAKFAAELGIIIQEPVYDTMCAAQMINNGDYAYRDLKESGLKTLAADVCGESLPSYGTVTAGKHFDELDPEDAETIRYSGADADFALRLYHEYTRWFHRFLPKHGIIVETVESPVSVYLGIMHRIGVPVDVSLMMKRRAEGEAEMNRLRGEIATTIGEVEIGANCSTAAFKKALYVDLGLPVLKETETGNAAVDDEALQLLSEWCDKNRPELSKLFILISEYKRWGKIISTYIDGYLKNYNSKTGRIHPDFLGLSTDTGRLCCRNPNLQNMPRKTNDPAGVRSFVKAPEGQVLISLDFSQIELRVGAFYCRDEMMMKTYCTGGDIHAQTTSVIFRIPIEEAQDKENPQYKERRAVAKNVNFGVFYGMWPKGLQKTLKLKAGINLSLDECTEILENLKSGYPKLCVWQQTEKYEAASHLYSETWLGRRRYLPDLCSEDWSKKAAAERCALNTPIQGTAADIIKIAMVRILRGLPERPWLQPILQIHDELVFLVPLDRQEEAISFIKECMERKPFNEFDIPLLVEASVGNTFGDMK